MENFEGREYVTNLDIALTKFSRYGLSKHGLFKTIQLFYGLSVLYVVSVDSNMRMPDAYFSLTMVMIFLLSHIVFNITVMICACFVEIKIELVLLFEVFLVVSSVFPFGHALYSMVHNPSLAKVSTYMSYASLIQFVGMAATAYEISTRPIIHVNRENSNASSQPSASRATVTSESSSLYFAIEVKKIDPKEGTASKLTKEPKRSCQRCELAGDNGSDSEEIEEIEEIEEVEEIEEETEETEEVEEQSS